MHSSTGLKLPLRGIAEAIARANQRRDEADRTLLCVDAVHGFGVEDASVAELGCDFFIAGCHKWLFGPRGTGIVWGRPRAWALVLPTIPGFLHAGTRDAWRSAEQVDGPVTASMMSPGGFKAFEHIWAASEAFRFHLQIGKARVQARTHELARQLKDGLAGMRHVTLRTPGDMALSSGIVCFEVAGVNAWRAADRLRARGVVASVTPYAVRYVRLAPSIRNTPDEVETALRAVRALR